MTQETTNQSKPLQTILEWLNNPLTKHYVRYLKQREESAITEAYQIIFNAILSGEIARTTKEISIFNQIRDYRTTYADFLNASELANKEDLTDSDKVELEDFFNNLIR